MNGPFGNRFPYTNFHELNLDWIIQIAKDFLDQYTEIEQTITTGKEELEAKYTELEGLLDAWYTEHSQDIADALAGALEDLNSWYTEHVHYLDQTITDFTNQAEQIAADTIASIPEDYTALSYSHQNMNSNNILDSSAKTDREVNGVTFDWTSSKCAISGTTSGTAFCNIFASENTFPAGLAAGSIFYAANIGQVKSKLEIFYYYNGAATLMYNSLATYDVDYIQIPSTATGLIVRLCVEQPNNTSVNETVYPFISLEPTNEILNARTYQNWIAGKPVFMRSTGDSRDRASDIILALNTYKHVVLLPGTYYIDHAIQIPAGGTLEGCGVLSKIYSPGTNVVSITMANNTTLKNLILDTGATTTPANEGTRYGIYINDVTQPAWIENCTVNGFNKYGIYIAGTTGNTIAEFINNTIITNCFTGLWVTDSEYLQFTNLCIRNCYRGVYENGGNNKYVGCGFDSNAVGLQMTVTYSNNGHGSFIGCSFNHNTDYAVYMGNVTNGEIFSGCQFHFGTITFNGTTRGINMIGCQFGQSLVLATQGDGLNFISNGTFYEDPTFSLSGAGQIIMTNCYNFVDGNTIEPA